LPDFIYDIESYPNAFTMVARGLGQEWIFEVSDRRNDSLLLVAFLDWLRDMPGARMVGFNNVGYDYPVLHGLYVYGRDGFTAADAYQRSMQIVETPWDDRFRNAVPAREVQIPQVDLYRIWHFDNQARRTSLKQIEIALRLPHVADLPFPPGTVLSPDQIPALLAYNRHDVRATEAFYHESRTALQFRAEMSEALGEDVTNASDSSIGSKVFISRLEAASPGACGRPGQWRQTPRASIRLADCILPYVSLEHPAFRAVLDQLRATTIRHTKGVFDDLTATCYGLTFAFGTGGIHGAVEGRTWRATTTRTIQGRDVSSYYPNLAIANRVYPAHLSETFCDIYKSLYDQRQTIPKSDPRNKALKLALNGTYGNSNNQYSPFYDPQYTMTITINGQLLLCMLAERLAQVPTVELIQVNTDGIEYAVDRDRVTDCDRVSAEWERLTGLVLEAEDYNLLCQRDVNNYVAVSASGAVKCKGAFEYQHGLEGGKPGARDGWHKNQSAKVMPMAAEALMVRGVPIAETVAACADPFLFMHTLKVQRTDRVMLGGTLEDYSDTLSPLDAKGKHPVRKRHTGGIEQQRTGRFYVARGGGQLWKIMAPLAKLPHHERPQAILKDVPVVMCNDLHEFDWSRLDRDWYVSEARALVESCGWGVDTGGNSG
jgi:hypothetical protein